MRLSFEALSEGGISSSRIYGRFGRIGMDWDPGAVQGRLPVVWTPSATAKRVCRRRLFRSWNASVFWRRKGHCAVDCGWRERAASFFAWTRKRSAVSVVNRCICCSVRVTLQCCVISTWTDDGRAASAMNRQKHWAESNIKWTRCHQATEGLNGVCVCGIQKL